MTRELQRRIFPGDDQFLQVDSAVKSTVFVDDVNGGDVVVLRRLIDQLLHGLPDADAFGHFDVVRGHDAADLVLIKGPEQVHVVTGVLVEEVHQIVALGFVQRFQVLYHLVGLHVGKYLNTLPEGAPARSGRPRRPPRIPARWIGSAHPEHDRAFRARPGSKWRNVGNIVFVRIFNFFFQRLGGDRAPDDGGQFLTVVGMLGPRRCRGRRPNGFSWEAFSGASVRFQIRLFSSSSFSFSSMFRSSFLVAPHQNGAGREYPRRQTGKRAQKSHCTEDALSGSRSRRSRSRLRSDNGKQGQAVWV